jgi:hypothetical protein
MTRAPRTTAMQLPRWGSRVRIPSSAPEEVALTSGNAMAPELGAILVGQSTNEQPTKRLLARQPGERICPLDRFRPGQTRIFDTKTAELLGEGGYSSKTSNRISGMRERARRVVRECGRQGQLAIPRRSQPSEWWTPATTRPRRGAGQSCRGDNVLDGPASLGSAAARGRDPQGSTDPAYRRDRLETSIATAISAIPARMVASAD